MKRQALLDRLRNHPAVHQRLLYWSYGPQFRRWCKSNPCETMSDRTKLYQFLIEREGLDGPIDYLEFGVSYGDSIRWWVANSKHPESTFVGFDTFEGLPEAWHTWMPKGSFSTEGKIPEMNDRRVSFVKGLFQDTLPRWQQSRDFRKRIVLHLDADLYSSTLVVLTQLLPKIKKNDILVFDEFDSILDEYKAFIDATSAFRREFAPLCRTVNWCHVALIAI